MGDNGKNTGLYTSLIAHLPASPAAEWKRLVGLLDKFIQSRNAAAAAWLRRQDHLNEARNAAEWRLRHQDPLNERFDAAIQQMVAARTVLKSRVPLLPDRWGHLHELGCTVPSAVPRGEDNESIVAELADFRVFVAGRKAARRGNAPALTPVEQEVLDLIAAHPPGSGITGKEICRKVLIDQSTLTTHVIPKLKRWYGVKNRRGAGYFLPKAIGGQ